MTSEEKRYLAALIMWFAIFELSIMAVVLGGIGALPFMLLALVAMAAMAHGFYSER